VKGDTIIGNDVWIGQNTCILPGVHIGDGVIVGVNSVVGSDIEPYSIVAGNPARLIRKRFDDELISLLLDVKWWDLPVEQMNELIPILSCDDLEKTKIDLKKMINNYVQYGNMISLQDRTSILRLDDILVRELWI